MRDEKLLTTAHEMAHIAGEISTSYFRKKIDVSAKSTKSLVTEVDLEIEENLRKYLNKIYPDHGVLGEEYGHTEHSSKYLWVIDPIDGTSSFICGKPSFCTLIALLYENKPLLGIIDQPILKERWVGELNRRTTFNHRECFNPEEKRDFLRLNCTTPLMFSKQQQEKFRFIENMVDVSCYGGDGYAYGLMASGCIDIIMEADLKFYDVAALIPIIEGSGGKITDWIGREINSNNFDGTLLAAQTSSLHQKILKMIL